MLLSDEPRPSEAQKKSIFVFFRVSAQNLGALAGLESIRTGSVDILHPPAQGPKTLKNQFFLGF